MTNTQRRDVRKAQALEQRVTLNLMIEGDDESAEIVRNQIAHYAQSLPGVRVE